MSSSGNVKDFSKEFFLQSWGPDGYYENFSYGVGIDKVCDVCLYPFLTGRGPFLEIGSGGGVFTKRIFDKVPGRLMCIDVIPKPGHFHAAIIYQELPDKDYTCYGVSDNWVQFAFSYNTFCHLSNDAITQYLQSVNRVLRPGGDFVFMLSRYGGEIGTLLPMGHFAQDERTLPLVIGKGWEIISPDMIPKHRDIIVHLKKQV